MQALCAKTLLAMFAVLLLGAQIPARAETTLDWMIKAYGDGQHNAFTDLVRWRNQYYLCFRHGAGHLSMDGEIRVMRSADLKTWQACGTLDTLGDDRDPHFAATETTLYVFFGTWDLAHAPGHGVPDRGSIRSHFASSEDGEHWAKVQGVYEPGWWLWRVRHHEDAFYSVGYRAIRPKTTEGEARLLRSSDALNWDVVATISEDRIPGEADIRFMVDGSIEAVFRTSDAAGNAMLIRSDPTLKMWHRKDLDALIHSPVMVTWKDRCFVAGRGRDDKNSVTRVWELADASVQPLLTLPSAGDTAYPGLVVDPETVDGAVPSFFISWYSQHERKPDAPDEASVYVARISIRP